MNTQPFPKSFPPVNDAIDLLSQVDYKNLWNKTVNFVATVLAIVIATVLWIYANVREHDAEIKAFARKVYTFVKDVIAFVQLWWEAHGDQVRDCFASAVLRTYNAGVAARALLSR